MPKAEPLWYMQRLINLMAQPFDNAKGKEFQLTLSQFRVMRTIATFPDTTAQEISEYEGFNSMLVSRAVTVLVQRELVVRQVNSADKRRLKLNLTAEGHDIFQQILPNMRKRHMQMLSPLTKQEQINLGTYLQKMLMRTSEPNIESLRDPNALIMPDDENVPISRIRQENKALKSIVADLKLENYLLQSKLDDGLNTEAI